ncbi:MAG: phosphate acetyltransferase [Candidatus Hydrogenedentes bacterium]|nr:phosphate acetyltransferase [Candidatus Hydrogenedentota bacterium]
MSFIENIYERARSHPSTIVLPEPEDERTLRAAIQIREKRIAEVVLVGNREQVETDLKRLGAGDKFEIVDPSVSPWLDEFVEEYFEMRKAKGATLDDARKAMLTPIPHGIMMLHKKKGDGLVAGAIHSTGDTLRPALQILRTAPGIKTVSSFFFMTFGETAYVFSDCGLVEDPTAEQLAEIAVCSAQSAISFGIDPIVAMLSYSTKGSAKSHLTEKVVTATRLAQDLAKERFGPNSPVRIDGELQADSALVEAVGSRKAPGSDVAGKAKVLIFPDLNSGNIAYKLVERLGGASAYGPIVQGLRLPANDLSRGCSAEDIVGVAAVTAIQAKLGAAS